ncbi:arrestin domain-containing protein [Aspergillus ibericus CBS 121593]|uniref:Arrestin domain-containing protein n=1 Tax=Aspergillus ibericus CBS 121593 TaxID=1448316 RepID=A0A395H8P5_9EURO|nr:arrestin domain-containing protein [Aspergillus ibericus CBS 121593]RAL02604.1 arrestin domain-containing protein [Aspergillus ibericus CBS 121593]
MIISLFRAASPPRNAPTYFDIRLDNDVIWLPGDDISSGYIHLNGKVILCLNQPLCVKDMKLHFEGWRYIKWDPRFPYFETSHQKVTIWDRLFMRQTWNFLRFSPSTSNTLPPGNHEFPFHFCLSSKTPDSIQGLDDCSIKYNLKAQIRTLKGTGFDITRSIRVCRMYRSLLIPEPKVLQNIWPDKIIYRVRSPSRTYTFDSVIPISFHFVPIRKGLTISSIQIQIIETHKAIQPSLGTRSRIIVQDDYIPPCWDELDTTSDDEGYWHCLTRIVHLPKDTKQCVQSTANTFLRVDHTLNIQIRLLNPGGNESAINLTWPISIHLPLPPSLGDGYISSMLESLRMVDETLDLPLPSYHDHVLDRTPDEIPAERVGGDTNGQDEPPDYLSCGVLVETPSYSTAVRSGASSPVCFYGYD